MTSRSARTSAALVLAFSLTVGLAGCGADDESSGASASETKALKALTELRGSRLAAQIRKQAIGPISYQWRQDDTLHQARSVPDDKARTVESDNGLTWINVDDEICYNKAWLSEDIRGLRLVGDDSKPWACGWAIGQLARLLIGVAAQNDPNTLASRMTATDQTRPELVTVDDRQLVHAWFGDAGQRVEVWVDGDARVRRFKRGETTVEVTDFAADVELPAEGDRGPLEEQSLG